MTAIWQHDGSNWHLLAPVGFPDEATLHSLVEKAPHLLPLAGMPRLVMLGREVKLGNGYADLMAVEPNGRITLIEIKLARNAEARRAVIAQIMAYAAYLWHLDRTVLEQNILSKHLQERGYKGLAHAVETNDQEGSFNTETFTVGVDESLRTGRFRLVLVLDEAPDELIRLVSYLETISEQLIIDLIIISAYTANGSQILVPQRVEAEPQRKEIGRQTRPLSQREGQTQTFEGTGDFTANVNAVSADATLKKLCTWSSTLEQLQLPLVKFCTYHGSSGVITLLPRLQPEDAGLVTIYNRNGKGSLQFFRSVFERRAPEALAQIETSIGLIRQQMIISEVSDELLVILTKAYREATSKPSTI